MKHHLLLLICLLWLAACTPAGESPTPTAAPTASLTTSSPSPLPPISLPTTTPAGANNPTPLPTLTREPTAVATATPAGPQIITGRTADGAYFIGATDAPVTLIDYSDFL